ncbi:hypothetical protein GCM10011399_15980 [Subtercola lobariae]|uniref:HTH marR-type domain-containing protein n=1 Tax=Subtercola lobariae TaxID=1588641 RepID=A0A917B7K3_9MICO|nr:hypothetical protein GCM10011399_15980 [Subtercola lobariae]
MKDVEGLYSELFEAASVGRRHGERIAALADQTQSRWQTLWTIDVAPLTVPQIARRLGVSRQHILRLTGELHAEGLVESRLNPDHKTSPLIVLTPAGEKILHRINGAGRISNQALLESLTPARIDDLRLLLHDFIRIISDEDARHI